MWLATSIKNLPTLVPLNRNPNLSKANVETDLKTLFVFSRDLFVFSHHFSLLYSLSFPRTPRVQAYHHVVNTE